MSNRFADGRSEAVTKHMGRGSWWHDTSPCSGGGGDGDLPDIVRSWWRHGTPLHSLLRAEISFRFTLTCSNGIIQLSPLSPGCQRVKHRLVFPAAFWAWWGHLLDSHEPAKRGWEWYLPPYTYRHTTQKQLFSKKQSQHRLIANNNFYENI